MMKVALRKESVDRNKYVVQCRKVMNVSLSARRAWIEITVSPTLPLSGLSLSARRAWIEIDANSAQDILTASLSARRAWIEI